MDWIVLFHGAAHWSGPFSIAQISEKGVVSEKNGNLKLYRTWRPDFF